MTAVLRRLAAPAQPVRPSSRSSHLWQQAVPVRREWLAVGLSTEPADRAAAEACLARIYARVLRPRPRFHWVDSPAAAVPLTHGLPGHDALYAWALDPATPPGTVAGDIATGLGTLRSRLDLAADHPDLAAPPMKKADRKKPKHDQRTDDRPPEAMLADGVGLRDVLRRHVRDHLTEWVAAGLAWPVRRALGPGPLLPVHWYGQQDAPWLAYYDVLRRLHLARYGPDDDAVLDDWVRLAHSAGWWWPGEDVCVVVERPAAVEPGWVRYRDGWRTNR